MTDVIKCYMVALKQHECIIFNECYKYANIAIQWEGYEWVNEETDEKWNIVERVKPKCALVQV